MAAQEFGEDKRLVHSGMLASAQWLHDRLYCVAQVPSHDHCMPFLSWPRESHCSPVTQLANLGHAMPQS